MIKFGNTKKAYRLKNTKELYKAFYLYKIISNNLLVSIGTKFALISLKFGLPVEYLFRVTIFSQFCAGIEKLDSLKVVEKLKRHNIKSYMHYAAEEVESEEAMDLCLKNILETLSFSEESDALPFTVFKATTLGSVFLFKKKSAKLTLNNIEQKEWVRALERIETCCKKAKKLNVKILIDAEESWYQPAIDEIAEYLMEQFNGEHAIIFTTLQMYRKDRLDYLKKLCERSRIKSFKIGIKLVRGAYIEKEKNRAKEFGYSSPICVSKEKTNINFNAAIDYILPRIKFCNLFLGTHNESSVLRVTKWMILNGLKNDYSLIWFSQLYGMADHISFNLAAEGYRVVKYVPYGPVRKVIPYLIRRAEENTSISGQTPRELVLIDKELKRRKGA